MVYPFGAAILKIKPVCPPFFQKMIGGFVSKDLPGHARYRHANEGCIPVYQEQPAELGWNHEYNTRPFTGTGVFCVFSVIPLRGGMRNR